jgi:diaminohydroxyphosphoribosylaminopyrimidine deaminase/5-amino-6-(5-phosphoribosylamino)uracil reductase
MRRAIRLACVGLGSTYPNPSVGAVIVSGARLIASGRTDPVGGPHAEIRAIERAGEAARGATMYVTLEPCCHVGRTGPCTEAILQAGLARVVVGVRDPAAHVGGKGLEHLRSAGVDVELGLLADACAEVHEHYLHHVDRGLPFVSLKMATSLDGRIATLGGNSKWITGLPARRHGHRLRAQHHAIAVGVDTVVLDDPQLDVRLVRGTSPIPVVFDSRLRLADSPTACRILRPGTLVLHTAAAPETARRRLVRRQVEPVEVPSDPAGRIDVGAALVILGRRQIRSLLVEGGGRLHGAFVQSGLWQRMFVYQAPRILGDGRSMVEGVTWSTVAEAPALRIEARHQLGEDLLTVAVPA